ncbi:MAG TPA: cupredoxin domain-containing protein, partial [Anaerolineales bacterium]|nr:cupredoxin domain-containing protein [Anaerolineales bacterium]
MKRPELLSRILIVAATLGAIGAPLFFWTRTPLIHAQMAEDGGWSPDVIQAEVGKPLHLRLTSDDVLHGFAVGQMQMDAVDIEPGKVTDIELTFDKPGIYTFFCTRWCGVNHWRMRGTIEVSGSDPEPVLSKADGVPLYVSLGLDIDATHDAPVIPETQPSAINGQQLAANLPISQYANPDFYRANSPYQLYENLNSADLSDSEKWDVVSYIWESNTTPEALANGRQLYAQNCAAC